MALVLAALILDSSPGFNATDRTIKGALEGNVFDPFPFEAKVWTIRQVCVIIVLWILLFRNIKRSFEVGGIRTILRRGLLRRKLGDEDLQILEKAEQRRKGRLAERVLKHRRSGSLSAGEWALLLWTLSEYSASFLFDLMWFTSFFIYGMADVWLRHKFTATDYFPDYINPNFGQLMPLVLFGILMLGVIWSLGKLVIPCDTISEMPPNMLSRYSQTQRASYIHSSYPRPGVGSISNEASNLAWQQK
jgi:hypothetical protein